MCSLSVSSVPSSPDYRYYSRQFSLLCCAERSLSAEWKLDKYEKLFVFLSTVSNTWSGLCSAMYFIINANICLIQRKCKIMVWAEIQSLLTRCSDTRELQFRVPLNVIKIFLCPFFVFIELKIYIVRKNLLLLFRKQMLPVISVFFERLSLLAWSFSNFRRMPNTTNYTIFFHSGYAVVPFRLSFLNPCGGRLYFILLSYIFSAYSVPSCFITYSS